MLVKKYQGRLFDGNAGGGAAGDDKSKGTDANTQTQGAAEKTFKQDDVNRISGDARKEGRDAAQRELFEQYGVKNADELAAKLKELDDLKAKDLTEQQRLQKERDDAKAAADAEKKKSETRLQVADDKIRKAALRIAAANDFRVEALDDIWTFVQSDKDLRDKLTLDADDNVAGIDDVLKVVKEKREFWLKPAESGDDKDKAKPKGTPSGTGKQGEKPSRPDNKQQEQVKKKPIVKY